ncbi:hypothetical protein GGQ11_000328 [Salinibacter ruber]|nr:hypothetical protein [Salinibacter ruber]MCS4116728.1 hypothetical protein [Salinibacter ruber]MCS4152853.1 hypothetical protein [Salinibacter ruber]MCS4168666.1 hypothetical protein [Salinibacter ruber]MCS4185438.1 hypothetical protein [Salinibacter ruber]
MYRSGQGRKWSRFPIYDVNTGFAGSRGGAIEIGDEVLMQPFYWRSKDDIDEAQEFRAMVTFSRDGGLTWKNPTDVLTSTDRSSLFNEASYVYLGQDRIVGLVRDEGSERYRQVKSTDNGETWTDVGPVPFSYGSFPHPPRLARIRNDAGKTVVLCYYANREKKQLLVIRASAQDLIEQGVEGWETNSRYRIATFTKKVSGYPSVFHFSDSCRAVGTFYDEKSDTDADIIPFSMNLSEVINCKV